MTSITPADRLAVGSADAVRCALGLLLPIWFYTSGLIVAVASLLGMTAGHLAPFIGFAAAAVIEGLRRRVIWTYDQYKVDGAAGASVTALLRSSVMLMLICGPLITCLLAFEWFTACFGVNGGCKDQVTVSLLTVFCAFAACTSLLAWRLLTQSNWMQPRR